MKQLLCITLACLSVVSVANADNHSGSMRGLATQSTIDVDLDGIPARDFVMPTILDWHFSSVDGTIDTALVAWPRVDPRGVDNTCPLDTDLQLAIQGKVVMFERFSKASVILEPDSSVLLCFTPGNEEVVELYVIGATNEDGAFRQAYGTAQIRLLDLVLGVDPVSGAPNQVLSTGDYTLDVYYD